MELKTRIGKGREGWEVETQVPMDGGYILRIATSKRFSGILATTASRFKLIDGGMTCVMFQDFSKTVVQEKVRVTEKSAIEQHKIALNQLDVLRAEVDAFYAQKEAA